MKKRKELNPIKYDESDPYHYKHHIKKKQKRYNELKGIISKLRFENDPRDEKYIDEYKKEIADIEEWVKDEGLVIVLHRDREKGVADYYHKGGGEEKKDWKRFTFEEPDYKVSKTDNKNDSKISTEISIKPIKQSEAFSLLKRLENPNYKLSKDDELMIKNNSFSNYSSKYLKSSGIYEQFDKSFEHLKRELFLTYEQFELYTVPSSKWYKNKYIYSFIYHCYYPKGRYNSKIVGKDFLHNKQKNINGKYKKCFVLIST